MCVIILIFVAYSVFAVFIASMHRSFALIVCEEKNVCTTLMGHTAISITVHIIIGKQYIIEPQREWT